MGNLDFSANADQLKELAAYMASQINVPTIGIGGGYAPIGSINFFDATTAPQDYLACDGTVYNIADYPQLADWYEAQHGSKNFYGGDGTTTFAVPDLRGEFLRGTGTNSHANQGSGAAVGVHQDGTEIPKIGINGNTYMNMYKDSSESENFGSNFDSTIGTSTNAVFVNGTAGSSSTNPNSYTSRPTNTSFLICVKAVVAGEVYSTDERVVGTWIDGRPVYQRVFNNLSIDITNEGLTAYSSGSIDPLLTGINPLKGQTIGLTGGYVSCEDVTIRTLSNGKWVFYANCDMIVNTLILQYTKTTDG